MEATPGPDTSRDCDDLSERRLIETAKYEEAHRHPKYDMKPWRQEIVREWLSKAPGSNYLDVGCGKAETIDLAKGHGWFARGCDVVSYLADRDDVDLIEGAHDLPYTDGQFAVSTCNDVLEHIIEEDVPQVLAEIRRVTRRAILLGISRKPGPLHITIKSEEWWLDQIRENMAGTATVVYADRIKPIKQPYLWVAIEC